MIRRALILIAVAVGALAAIKLFTSIGADLKAASECRALRGDL
jgi:hypothetical protein